MSLISTLFIFFIPFAQAETATTSTAVLPEANKPTTTGTLAVNETNELNEQCVKELSRFQGPSNKELLKKACSKVKQKEGCRSVQGRAIYHYDRAGDSKTPKKIFVMSLIHGDEGPSGTISRSWMERLEMVSPRNTWRVVPLANPDGYLLKTRTNANQVDLNRNFPTKDWTELAIQNWRAHNKSHPRRYPGAAAASEPEVRCILEHLNEFQPDFIVSIHTPLKVLDYDGPKIKPPKFDPLPWKSLGHYPGSLGRYMWFERQVPVLTTELDGGPINKTEPYVLLQDLIGTLVQLDLTTTQEKIK